MSIFLSFIYLTAFLLCSSIGFHFHTEPSTTNNIIPTSITPSYLRTLTQRIDNFDPQNLATFTQQYYEYDGVFQPDGPILIMLSKEAFDNMGSTLLSVMARENHGIIFNLEHRFYGGSRPTSNLSTENLRFLTPSQAVADVAHFVEHIKRSVPGTERSAVLVFGYHYTGSLAAWSRQKYPHLVDAAWASSSPLQSVVNHTDFTVLTGWSWMETGGLSCYARISNGFRELEQMIANNEMARLTEMFGMCDELPNTEMDAATFFSGLFEYYSLVAKQLNFFESQIPYFCSLMAAEPTAADGVARFIRIFMGNICTRFSFAEMLSVLRDESYGFGYRRQDAYQMCLNLGWMHTSDMGQQPFGSSFPITFYRSACEAVFGPSSIHLPENSIRLNIEFGGLSPNVTNVLFTQGSMDPWITVGVQEDLNAAALAIVHSGATHANDILLISEFDSPEMAFAKREIIEILNQWVGPPAAPVGNNKS